jgi:hypothetical protein
MLLIGIDQSPERHVVCIIDPGGRQLAQLALPYSADGFRELHHHCQMLGAPPQECLVALESDHSLVVDYLFDHGYPVYVVPGKAVDRYRDRHRQSRSISDAADASVLANILRTDRHVYVPWEADMPITRRIRSDVKLVMNLKRTVIRFSNQLRNLLWRYYPVAAELFSGLDHQIALEFIQAFPTPQGGLALTREQFTTFCRAHHYRRSDLIVRRYGQLLSAETCAWSSSRPSRPPRAVLP